MKIDPLPPDSRIEVQESFDAINLSWPNPSSPVARILFVGFLCLWLCGWAAGEAFTIREIASGDVPWPVKIFLVVWLAFWTVGGLVAIWAVVHVALPPRPETLALGEDSLVHGVGVAVPTGRAVDPEIPEPSPFRKRGRRRLVPRASLGTVRTEADPSGEHRLLAVFGGDEVELGRNLSDAEKEWVADLLRAWKSIR